ncbi:MAG: hypothetical protein LRZ97_01735, partial [Candidatus Pacebacteria bacterium]|nr:hypothetical protein [Candidatus Paceibacterota bacterium]
MSTGTFLLITLFVTFIAFMIFSTILLYHWFKYAMSNIVATAASISYMGLGFVLLFVMLVVST